MVKNIHIIKSLLMNPEEIYQEMMRNNLDFRNFVEDNKNKSTEEIAKEHNLDLFV